MKKAGSLLVVMLLLFVGCAAKKPMQVIWVENPQVYVGEDYQLKDFVKAVENGKLFFEQVTYKATQPGIYHYVLKGIDQTGEKQEFTLEVRALAVETEAEPIHPFNLPIVEVGIEGFPINYDLLDSQVSDELIAEGQYFGTLTPTRYDQVDYYQMPYFNFLFSVPAVVSEELCLYVRYLESADLAVFGLYLPDPEAEAALQFETAVPVEVFVVMRQPADPEHDPVATEELVMQLGENYVYKAAESNQDFRPELLEKAHMWQQDRPYITIYN